MTTNTNQEFSLPDIFERFDEEISLIEIPVIQRDYAQGRESAKEIRNNFLSKLKESLENNTKLQLDFVYGSIRDKKFIPLDGQQRLTTLFLLYWYLSVKDNKIDVFRKIFTDKTGENTYKSKFRYKVRAGSEEFLDYLVSENIDLNQLIDGKLSKTIQDKTWFYLGWKYDATISGILNMLDDIHHHFNNTDIDIYKNLITFFFLKLEDFGLTDDLYIKMNSRGKLLTPYENFKAKFEKLISQKIKDEDFKKTVSEIILKQTDSQDEQKIFMEIAKRFDTEYQDFFWKLALKTIDGKKKDIAKINDNYQYNFFYNITLNLFAAQDLDVKDAKQKEDYKKLDDFINKNSLISFFKDVYDKSENLLKLLIFLERLKELKNDQLSYIKSVSINKLTDPSLWDRVRFHAFYLGIIYHKDDNHWLRVTKNLINNTLIQSLEDYIKAIKAINTLSENLKNKNILEYISDKENVTDFFRGEQQKEEIQKAKLILGDKRWENEIITTENNWYLDGKIGFLLSFSVKTNSHDLGIFKQYRDKFIALWHFEKQNDENKTFIYQALLTKGNYLPDKGRNKTFCSFETGLRSKMDNWFKVFEEDNRRYFLKTLLDDISLNGNVYDELKRISNNYPFDIDDWKSLFIKNESYIKYCWKQQIRYIDDSKIHLLRKTQINGIHSELFSKYLYDNLILNREIFDKIQHKYEESNSWQDPYILLTVSQNENFVANLKIYNIGNSHFKMNIFNDNNEFPETIKDFLESNGFEQDTETQEYSKTIGFSDVFHEDAIIEFIKQMTLNMNP